MLSLRALKLILYCSLQKSPLDSPAAMASLAAPLHTRSHWAPNPLQEREAAGYLRGLVSPGGSEFLVAVCKSLYIHALLTLLAILSTRELRPSCDSPANYTAVNRWMMAGTSSATPANTGGVAAAQFIPYLQAPAARYGVASLASAAVAGVAWASWQLGPFVLCRRCAGQARVTPVSDGGPGANRYVALRATRNAAAQAVSGGQAAPLLPDKATRCCL